MKIFATILLILYSALVTANEPQNKSGLVSIQPKSWDSTFITIGYKYSPVKLEHKETSTASGYSSLSKTVSVSANSLQVGMAKEMLENHFFSVTFSVGGGYEVGQQKGTTQGKSIIYTDKLTGNNYFFSGSLNANVEIYKMKMQPFAGVTSTLGSSKYFLTYSGALTSSVATTIQYREKKNIMEASSGVRFIDPSTKLLSFLVLNYVLSDTGSSTGSANYNKVPITITNAAPLNRKWSFAVGFGFTFK